MTIKEIEANLRGVVHPAFEKNIIDLGLIEDIKIEKGEDGSVSKIKFKLVFKTPDALSGSIKKSCEEALLRAYPWVKVSIMELVREGEKPKKNDIRDLDNSQLHDVARIIAVASGKGGVGKSTVTVNLAIALAKMGFAVGVADADVYGPSIPKMTDTEHALPAAEYIYEDGYSDDGAIAATMQSTNTESGPHGKISGEIILPVEKYGVKWMSIGYFAAPDQALIWRGPMACNALKQMILQVKWGKLDYLLIDLPPGTGDIHISLVKDIPLDGAIIVSTPQAVALTDVEKGINMFRNKDIDKPVYGIVENMAWFTPAELPNNKYYIFGKNGCKALGDKYHVPILAQIPLIQSIRESGDDGKPAALAIKSDITPDPTGVTTNNINGQSEAFDKLASALVSTH